MVPGLEERQRHVPQDVRVAVREVADQEAWRLVDEVEGCEEEEGREQEGEHGGEAAAVGAAVAEAVLEWEAGEVEAWHAVV